MTPRRIAVELTPAQLRMVNSALALFEAEDHDWRGHFPWDVLHRTRAAVHAAMEQAGIAL